MHCETVASKQIVPDRRFLRWGEGAELRQDQAPETDGPGFAAQPEPRHVDPSDPAAFWSLPESPRSRQCSTCASFRQSASLDASTTN